MANHCRLGQRRRKLLNHVYPMHMLGGVLNQQRPDVFVTCVGFVSWAMPVRWIDGSIGTSAGCAAPVAQQPVVPMCRDAVYLRGRCPRLQQTKARPRRDRLQEREVGYRISRLHPHEPG
jgi:hypothetical protein